MLPCFAAFRASGSSKPLPCNGGSRRQHLAHAGPTFRAFITDDDHIAFLDLTVIDGFERSLFALKDARGSFKGAVGVTGGFQDRAFRRVMCKLLGAPRL